MKIKSRSGVMMMSMFVIIAVSALFITLPEGINAQQEENVFVTHSGAVVKTTGEILDPLYTSATVEFDPMEYLRDFNYGRISQLPDNATLREFTIIANDDEIMEVSPGIFYNVWTYNGTVPGPTIRATEGDIVRIKFINNGEKQHTIHFHGIHPAGMDGVFEPVGGNGGQFIYEFEAGPVGVHPYHCHVMPLEETHSTWFVWCLYSRSKRKTFTS